MPRRYHRRRSYAIARPLRKYSNETYIINLIKPGSATIAAGDQLLGVYSPKASTLGTRKIKNFTLSLSSNNNVPFVYALVYVPEGTQPSTLKLNPQTITTDAIDAISLYEPNQNVIMSGMFGGPSGQIIKAKTRLARNLNSNDFIVLIIAPVQNFAIESGESFCCCCALNFAITY